MLDTKFVVVGVTLLAFISGFFVNVIMLRNGYLLDLANVEERPFYYDLSESAVETVESPLPPTPPQTPVEKTVTATATVTALATVTKTITAKTTVTAKATVTVTVTQKIKEPASSCAPPPAVSPAPPSSSTLETKENNSNNNTAALATSEKPYCLRNYKYIILSVQRSGTHYLSETLHLNPYLYIPSEIFKAEYNPLFRKEYNINSTLLG